MKRSVSLLTAALFCAFLLLFGCWFLLQPPREFSDKENRVLAQFPELNTRDFFSGQWGLDFEEYLSDQFPLRDEWIVLKAALQRASGRQDNNGVYFGDRLTDTFWSYDKERLARNLAAVESFAARGETYFVPVPNAVEVLQEQLPPLAPDADQEALLDQMAAAVPSAVTVNALPALNAAEDAGQQLYFSTDHHMTTRGAYVLYREIVSAMGITPLEEDGFLRTTVTESFTGTMYHKSGAWWTTPDTIERWDPVAGLNATLTIYPDETVYDSLYNEAALSGNDPYTYFLHGNQPLEVIRTDGTGPKLLLVKDSYAHILAPFLANHFSEIHLVDLRYYRQNADAYRAQHGIDTTLVLYHVKNLTEDTSLPLLGQ